jgi:hypothetical protein
MGRAGAEVHNALRDAVSPPKGAVKSIARFAENRARVEYAGHLGRMIGHMQAPSVGGAVLGLTGALGGAAIGAALDRAGRRRRAMAALETIERGLDRPRPTAKIKAAKTQKLAFVEQMSR